MNLSKTALAGLRVVEFGQWIAAPCSAAILADLGADVIKVEKPRGGDDQRHSPPFVEGESALFMQMNRNKRAITLDLQSAQDHARALRLASHADVVLNNFRAGSLESHGLGYEDLRRVNPSVIYCAISGFGREGPLAGRAGMDLIAQAASGVMVMNRDDTGRPQRIPIAIADLATGLYATIGILAAVSARQRTGQGQFLDLALLDSLLAMLPYETASFLGTGQAPDRYRKVGSGNAAPYQVFATQDGWLVIVAVAQHLWVRLCEELERPDLLSDPRFATNASRIEHSVALEGELEKTLRLRTTAEWMRRLEARSIPCSEVLTLADILTHEHVRARRFVAGGEGTGLPSTVVMPMQFSATPPALHRPAPLPGEHTDEVLGRLDAEDGWPLAVERQAATAVSG